MPSSSPSSPPLTCRWLVCVRVGGQGVKARVKVKINVRVTDKAWHTVSVVVCFERFVRLHPIHHGAGASLTQDAFIFPVITSTDVSLVSVCMGIGEIANVKIKVRMRAKVYHSVSVVARISNIVRLQPMHHGITPSPSPSLPPLPCHWCVRVPSQCVG